MTKKAFYEFTSVLWEPWMDPLYSFTDGNVIGALLDKFIKSIRHSTPKADL
jgi:glutamate synthase domain-containing protein 1